MKTEVISISSNKVAKIYYSINTGYHVQRRFKDDMVSMEIVIGKLNSSVPGNHFIRDFKSGQNEPNFLSDLQLYINSVEPIIKDVKITTIEFLANEYYAEAHRLQYSELEVLCEAIKKISEPKIYTNASDFYNDLIITL